MAPPSRARLVGGILLVVLVAALAGQQYLQAQERRAEEEQLQRYLNGVWAMEVERWDLAIEELSAAGDFRDAPQRLEQARAHSEQARERYDEALAAYEEGHLWSAAYQLEQVLAAIPGYGEAERYLEEVKARMGMIGLVRQAPNTPLEDATSLLLTSPTLREEQTLARDLFEVIDGSFSPDGAWFLYEALDDDRIEMRVVEIRSGRQVVLIERAQDTWSRWSPDGRWLLYGFQGQEGWSVFLRDMEARHTRRLLHGADLASGDFSPRGGWSNIWVRNSNQWTLYLLEVLPESELITVVPMADTIGLEQWSRDDVWLGYGYLKDGVWQLFLMELATLRAEQLAPESDYSWLSFRPGSRHFLLWESQPRGGQLTLNGSGGRIQELLRGALNVWARWSANGRWLATTEWNGHTWALRLYDVPRGGSPEEVHTLAQEFDEWALSFSPDSKYLLYQIFNNGAWSVGVLSLETGEEHLLLNDAPLAQAEWSPDSKHVLMWWLPGEESDLRVHDAGAFGTAEAATGRRTTLLQDVRAVQGAFSRDGSRMAFATQPVRGAPSVWVASPGGEELLELDRNSYRVYWARAPFQFGPHAPGPVGQ